VCPTVEDATEEYDSLFVFALAQHHQLIVEVVGRAHIDYPGKVGVFERGAELILELNFHLT
jgi:hypothetical protein